MELNVFQSKIYEIRGVKVMLDFDLASLYEVETRSLKQAVRRNNYRFPDDFMFQLNKIEWQELITNCDKLPESINLVRKRHLLLVSKELQCSVRF